MATTPPTVVSDGDDSRPKSPSSPDRKSEMLRRSREAARRVNVAKRNEDLLGMLLLSDESATHAAVKKAYKSLALMLHPDKVEDDQQCREAFVAVGQAYSALQDASKFAEYIAKRRISRSPSCSANVVEALYGKSSSTSPSSRFGTGFRGSQFRGGVGGGGGCAAPTAVSHSWWETSRANPPPSEKMYDKMFGVLPSRAGPEGRDGGGSGSDKTQPVNWSSVGSALYGSVGSAKKMSVQELFGKNHPTTIAFEAMEKAKSEAAAARAIAMTSRRHFAASKKRSFSVAYSPDGGSSENVNRPQTKRRRVATPRKGRSEGATSTTLSSGIPKYFSHV